jgi:hypothetical protein
MIDIVFSEDDISEAIKAIYPVYDNEDEYQAQFVLPELVKFVLSPINQ